MNPNNCKTCLHKQHPDGGWCYMFRDEPTTVCMQHTGRSRRLVDPAPNRRYDDVFREGVEWLNKG